MTTGAESVAWDAGTGAAGGRVLTVLLDAGSEDREYLAALIDAFHGEYEVTVSDG